MPDIEEVNSEEKFWQGDEGCEIVGMVKLTHFGAKCRDVLDEWPKDGELQFEMFQSLPDAFLLNVVNAVALTSPVAFFHRMGTRTRIRPLVSSLSNRLFAGALPGEIGDVVCKDGRSIGEVLDVWGVEKENVLTCGLVYVLPRPLVEMVIAGKLSNLIMLGRYTAAPDLFKEIPDFPPQSWAVNPFKKEVIDMKLSQLYPGVALEAQQFILAANYLQKLGSQKSDGERQQLRSLVSYLQNVARTLQGATSYSASQIIGRHMEQATIVRFLKQTAKLQDVLQHSLAFIFPGTKMSNDNQALGMSTDMHIHKDQLRMDIALLLTRRELSWDTKQLRYGWSDSSLQGSGDWFLWKYRALKHDDVIEVVDAIRDLTLQKGGCMQPQDDDDEFETPMDQPSRVKSNAVLQSKVSEHLMIPVCVSRSGLQDKVACGVHQHWFESHNLTHLSRSLCEYRSFTIDLGTEAKISDFRVPHNRLNTLMPPWMASRACTMPLQMDSLESDDQVPMRASHDGSGHDMFLPNSMTVPGVNHLIHSVVEGTEESLQHYPTFIKQMRVVESVLSHAFRKERIVALCIQNTPYADQAHVLERFSYTLYEKRWSSVLSFCKCAMAPIRLLRRVWSHETYDERGRGTLMEKDWAAKQGSKFDPKESTTILRCPLFRGYHLMIVKLKRLPTKVSSFFESCPCHEKLILAAGTRRKIERSLKKDGLCSGYCPVMSCQAWNVIGGRLESFFDEIEEMISGELQVALELRQNDSVLPPMSDQQFSLVMVEFKNGCARTKLGLTVKFSWRTNLPYLLMGIGHPNVSTGQAIARQCVHAFERTPRASCHRIALNMLEPNSVMRRQMDTFIRTGTMGSLLKFEASALSLIPFSDRVIEREHLYLSSVARPKSGVKRGHNFSTHRMMHITKELENPAFDRVFTDWFSKLTKHRVCASLLGLDGHPVIAALLASSQPRTVHRRHHTVWSMMESLVYRQDIDLKFTSYNEARAAHASGEKTHNNATKDAAKTREVPTSIDHLLLLNALSHLNAVADNYSLVSLPSITDGANTLETTSVEQI